MPSIRQERLADLIRSTHGTIRIEDAIGTLGLDRKQATKLLSNWHNQGIIRRVSQGVYVWVHPAALNQTQIVDDPWVLVPHIFAPGYIGGWSALGHWGFTEQVFRSVCVLSQKRVNQVDQEIQGVRFYIKHIPKKLLFGTKSIWRGETKILISDPHKTILDILNFPHLGAGIQHCLDAFKEYARSDDADLDIVFDYAKKLGNGAVLKKIGYFSELAHLDAKYLKLVKSKITKGYAKLDPQVPNKKLITRWRLWVPDTWPNHD